MSADVEILDAEDSSAARRHSRNTLAAYRVDMAQFGVFLADRELNVLTVEPDELAAYVAELAIGRAGATAFAAATLHRKVACLRSFYARLHRSAMIERTPARAERPAADQAPPPVTQPRRDRPAARAAARCEPRRAARPRAARAAVRVGDLRLGSDRARAPRR
ncbi:MAG: site-specific integrase [Solirubrobacteraceae bacterium]